MKTSLRKMQLLLFAAFKSLANFVFQLISENRTNLNGAPVQTLKIFDQSIPRSHSSFKPKYLPFRFL